MSWLFALGLLLILAWIICASQVFIAYGLKVTVMAKTVGDLVTVTVGAIPDGAPITNVVVTADPAFFGATADPLVFTALAQITGATISATAQAADGSSVSGVSDPFDVAAIVIPPVIATGLVVGIA